MPHGTKNRQTGTPGSRNVPFGLKLTQEESAAVQTVAQVTGTEPPDLLRACSINAIVSEYRSLIAKAAKRPA
jgi:hypothetical protein